MHPGTTIFLSVLVMKITTQMRITNNIKEFEITCVAILVAGE